MAFDMRDGVVIGEGVLLENQPTSFVTRALGAMIDVAVTVLVFLAVMFALAVAGGGIGPDAAQILAVVLLVLAFVVVPTTVETLTRGRSLGKLAVGIRIVRDDGGPVRFRQALVRALVGVLELWLTMGSVALITSIVNPRGKRLGDLLAGTYAIRVRGKVTARAVVPMPPRLAGWAAGADVGRLPDGLALSVRQFLVRAPGLHPASRRDLGGRLADEALRHVAPPPPPGVGPEEFLAAVVAARRDRDYRVLVRAGAGEQRDGNRLRRLPFGIDDPEN
ncbi:RDD family protein [Cellulomonas denverensis]|uniref:RDD family protein n=1 Tax=Cellulomonas denverensis TaxID=264297 RepID=A0A7X6QYW3_9CELL|nr:RDD family protein [Cellulomonas denverensis]NKY22553.1 RDD family protein [Cellulomonas denverensis]GIG24802.1 RDD family protein [Cellulomonas denverensis]